MPKGFIVILRLLFFVWLVFTIQFYTEYDLGFLGIYPRQLFGTIGIFTAPFIHGSTEHVLSNTIPLLLLGAVLFFFYQPIALEIFFRCYFFTNILVWIFGRPFYHIGASGLVYGLAIFLITYGLFRRNLRSILISTVVLIFYGGILYTLFPLNEGISWESHLFGSLTGLVSAVTIGRSRRKKQFGK